MFTVSTSIRVIPILLLLITAVAETSAAQESPPQLKVGFTGCYRARLPLDTFVAQHPEFPVTEAPYNRNPWDAALNRRLPYAFDELPQVFAVIAGRRSEDIPQLADRGLLEPVEPILAELGLSPDDFLPNVREAVTYRGRMWAIPHHVQSDGLFVHRARMSAFGLKREYGSWEELLAAAEGVAKQKISTPLGETVVGLSAFETPFAFAETLALLTGEAPVDYATCESWASPRMAAALDFLQDARQRGLLEFRTPNQPLRLKDAALFGIDHIESVEATSPYVLIPYPNRLRQADPPVEQPVQMGMLEAWAVRSNSPESREAVLAYLRWLLSAETEWTVFEATNQRTPESEWVIDSVHVPLRPALLQSVDFEYAGRKFPEFAAAVEMVRQSVFPANPQETENVALRTMEEGVNAKLGTAPAAAWLPELKDAVLKSVVNEPVASATYALY